MFFRRKKSPEPASDTKDKHQRIDKIHVLKRCQLFKMLSGWELSSISRLTRIVEFKKDEIVYRNGDSASSFYIVISGRFEAYIGGAGTPRQVLAYIKQGGHFGEMSLLSPDEKHSATVQSLSDGLVLEIEKDDFKKIVENNAAISLEITRILSARLRAQNVDSRTSPHLLRSDIVAVYSSHRQSGQTAFSINLAASLHQETGQKTILVDMSPSGNVIFEKLQIGKRTDLSTFADLEKGVEGALANHLVQHPSGIDVLNLATGETSGRAVELAMHLLNRLSVDFRFIVIDLPNQLDEMVEGVMAQCDQLFFVTDNNMANVTEIQQIVQELGDSVSSNDKTKIVISESLLGFSPTRSVKEELFGSKDCFFLPAGPARHEEGSAALVVLEHPDMDYSKIIRLIARKISRNLVGVALGSGAALGFAHIGVLKVLEREKIPVDMISGSSMGALIAAFYATGRTSSDLEAIAARMNKFMLLSKIDIPFVPVRGLVKGRRFERYFEDHLRDATFENTKIPLIIVGMSLLSRREIVMQSGLIAQAVRASIAIPGIFYPVTLDGDTIVDGGIIDPLPIRPLADMGANKIIAVDVLPTSNDVLERRRYHEEIGKRMDAKMKNRNILTRAIYQSRKALSKALTPNMFDIIVNSIQTMEHEMAESASAEADILIRPSMPLVNWTEFHRSKEIIRQGELAAEAKLDELKAIVKQQSL